MRQDTRSKPERADLTISVSRSVRPTAGFVLSHPAHFIAFGFGSGLSPVAPGTAGTLLALPLYLALSRWLPDSAMFALILVMFAIGLWACEVTGRHLGVHDHGGMVWDEIVAFMLVLFFTPPLLIWQAFAFLLFRLFDILKPPPIRRVDRGVGGGLGVMLDDILAAFYALLCLAAGKLVLG
jgi:phosphatidylglycerophosphatase A